MKNVKFILSILAVSLIFYSCSLDDDKNGSDDDPLPINVNATLYATSNTNTAIAFYDFTDVGVSLRTALTLSGDNEGIFYDDIRDQLFVNSRMQKTLNVFDEVGDVPANGNLEILFSSTTDLVSPRDLAVNDNIYVVSDNSDVDGNPETNDGRLFVYTRSGDSFILRNTITVNYSLWGIEFIGNDLYTVVDKTADVAVFKNLNSNYTATTTEVPDKRITIGGITRTHGITADGGTVVLTDIGDAAVDDDGGFHIINNFVTLFDGTENGGTLAVSGNQVRVSGAFTQLGNPVSVEYDSTSRSVFIAERANEGGKILFYNNIETGGNIAPLVSSIFPGASSVYYIKK